MGCKKVGHQHNWTTSGELVIERCEQFCNFCEGKARQKPWKFAWFLRRHVRSVHVEKGPYHGLVVSGNWDKSAENGKAPPRKKGRKTLDCIKQEREGMNGQQQLPPYEGLQNPYAVNPADLTSLDAFIQDENLGNGILLGNDFVDPSEFGSLIGQADVAAALERWTQTATSGYHQALGQGIPFPSIEQTDDVAFTVDPLEFAATEFGVPFDPYSPPATFEPSGISPFAYDENPAFYETPSGEQEGNMPEFDLPIHSLPNVPDKDNESLNDEQASLTEPQNDDATLLPSEHSFFEDEWLNLNPDEPFYMSDVGTSSPAASDFEDMPIAQYYKLTPPSPTQSAVDALGAFAAVHDELRGKGIDADDMRAAFHVFQRGLDEIPGDTGATFSNPETAAGFSQS